MDKDVVSAKKESKADPSSKRKFSLDTGEEFFVRQPTAEEIRQSDWLYSKIYNEAFLNGVMTAAQMMEEMKKRGIVSDEYEKEVNDTREKIATSLIDLAAAKDLDDKEKAAIRLTILREEMTLLNHRINGPLSNTCEQLAEDAKLDYITASVVEDGSGNKAWTDYDSYVADQSNDKVFKARLEVMLFLRNVESDFLEKSPEQVALREVREERIKESEKNAEDIKELVEKKPKKSPAKKTRAKTTKAKSKPKTTRKKTTKRKPKPDVETSPSEE